MWFLFVFFINIYCCTLSSNEINIKVFYENNVHRTNIRYVNNETEIVVTPCLFTQDENITIILENHEDSIYILSILIKHLNQNETNLNGLNIILALFESFESMDADNLMEVCHTLNGYYKRTQNTEGFNHYYYSVLENVWSMGCSYLIPMQNLGETHYKVLRGKDLRTKNYGMLATQAYFKKRFEEKHINKTTTKVLETINYYADYLKYAQTYMSYYIDHFVDYFQFPQTHFSHYWMMTTTSIGGIALNPIKFKDFVVNHDNNYVERWREKNKHVGVNIDFSKIYNILSVKSSQFSNKVWDRYKDYQFDHYEKTTIEYEQFNGTCYPLNTTENEEDTTIKYINYLILHKLWDMWDPGRSRFRPDQKIEPSEMRVWMPRDWVKYWWLYFNWFRRSPFLKHLWRHYALEHDEENCKPGWPVFRDAKKYNCSVTVFINWPSYFSLAEESILKNEIDTKICHQWRGVLGAMQGWTQYINAIIMPYATFPFIVPSFFICNVKGIRDSVSWAFFEVNDKVPCKYEPEDIPLFAEICLIYKSIVLWLLIALFLFFLLIAIISCGKTIVDFNQRFAVLNRVAALEHKVFKENRLVIPREDDESDTPMETLKKVMDV